MICKFIKIDHAEAWKMSYQPSSGYFQELKTTPHTEHFRPINLTFIWLFLLQRSCSEMKMPSWPI